MNKIIETVTEVLVSGVVLGAVLVAAYGATAVFITFAYYIGL